MTPPIEFEEVITPDVPSSSPGMDAMDMSPLPHKAPYFVPKVTLPSPSPELTPDLGDDFCDNLLSPQELPIEQAVPVQAPSLFQLPEYVLCPSCWS